MEQIQLIRCEQLSKAIAIGKELMADRHTSVQASIMLIERLESESEHRNCQTILQTVAFYGCPHSAVTVKLLDSLGWIEFPSLILEYLPSISGSLYLSFSCC